MSSLAGCDLEPDYHAEGFWKRWARGLWRTIAAILALVITAAIGGLTLLLIYLVFRFFFWGALAVCVILILGWLGMED